MEQIQYNSFTHQAIEGTDVRALQIAVRRKTNYMYPCNHLMYQSAYVINNVMSFLRNKCIIRAAVNHVKSGCVANVATFATIQDNLPMIKTYYYDDLLE